MKAIQDQEKGVISSQLNAFEDYKIIYFFRRRTTTVAINAPNEVCSDEDIDRNNRWWTEDRAGSRQSAHNMLQLYTNRLEALEADLRFSSCL